MEGRPVVTRYKGAWRWIARWWLRISLNEYMYAGVPRAEIGEDWNGVGVVVEDWRQDRIGAAERGENPTVLARLTSGFAVMGDTLFPPVYCLLLASPQVGHLTDLPLNRRSAFLREMSLIGEAIEGVCWPLGLRRVNYEILGNTDPYLHAHVFPRYDWEPLEYGGNPVFRYPPAKWFDSRYQLSEKTHGLLRAELPQALQRLIGDQGLEGAGG